MSIFILLVVTGALVALQGLVIGRFALRGISYERRFSATSANVGDTVEMIEVIRNRKLLPVPWLKAESRISPYLQFQSDADVQIAGERYHKSVFYLKSFQQITRTHRVTLRKRGYYKAGSVSLQAGDLFAVKLPVVQADTGAAIEVYPRLLSPGEIPLPSTRWQGDLLVKRWIIPDPVWVNGVRPYTAGDERKDIHWRATARTGQLQVKVHEKTADPKMLVIVNTQMSETQWGDLMEYEQQVVETMISLTATLCLTALRGGVEAGFAINVPVDEEDDPTVLLPARSSARVGEILSTLAHLTIKRTRTILKVLDDLCLYTGLDMLLLSVYDSPLLQTKLTALRRAGNTATLQLIDQQGAQEAAS
ncbi:MAG TPA: DUF58 domain-containing protein [Candidatus Limiplasma sp.]|nr:DUF58 domain-containing protein [Candidatus Limiplasma sp.]HRX08945.1 DUF58 domain-containing protein [Candidatus Limiplasma sp.]